MARIPRGLRGNGVAHVLSRGNNRATVFQSDQEYEDFIALLDGARRQHAVELFAFCLMPNHFHVVVRYEDPAELSSLMQWWLTAHVRRHHQRHGTSGRGHIWQDRFKSFPVQEDNHLLTLLRYVLANPVRAGLCQSADAWRWSSLWFPSMLSPWPVEPPVPLSEWLACPGDSEDERSIRNSIRRGAPFGDEYWRVTAARAGGLEASLRPRGRPRTAAATDERLQLDLY